METKQLVHVVHALTLPTFGKCTLLSVGSLPQALYTYNNILKTAQALGLSEIGETSHKELQEIARALAYHIKQDSWIWISGVIQAYAEINPHTKEQKLRDCVLNLILSKSFDNEEYLEPWLEYVPVDKVRDERDTDNGFSFCLFRGEA